MGAVTARWAGIIRQLGQELSALQRPLRILRALRWGTQIKQRFLAAGGRELPHVTRETYEREPLPFEPGSWLESIQKLQTEIERRLGCYHPAGKLLSRRCQACRSTVRLWLARGTEHFSRLSAACYGLGSGINDQVVLDRLNRLQIGTPTADGSLELSALDVRAELDARLRESFPVAVPIRLAYGLAARAVACGETIRIRAGARFGKLDAALLEAHECWVHLGTTHNGRRQPVMSCLARAVPPTTATQEGLAVLCEILAGTATSFRLARVIDRFRAVRMAGHGADFLDVYRFWQERGCEPGDAYDQSVRIFRGSLPKFGPFAKDAAYSVGLVQVLDLARRSLNAGLWNRFLQLFAGKFDLTELPLVASLSESRILAPPAFIPPPFRHAELTRTRLAKVS